MNKISYSYYEPFTVNDTSEQSDKDLLEKYKPKTYISKSEKYNLVNAIDYFQFNKINYDNSILCGIDRRNSKIYLYYFYSFEQDGGKDVLGVIKHVDAHKDDIECVVVELTGDKVTGLCYMPHASTEHFWIKDKNDINTILNNSTHPTVYITNSKHSAYPISGPIYRLFFFGNDSCSSPVLRNTNLLMINTYLLKTNSIGEGMVGFGRRITKETNSIAVIRLKDLQYKQLFVKFW
jgi:hypothetical protein